MSEDKALSHIRKARHQISEECAHDPRRLISYYKQLQAQHKDRLLQPEEKPDEINGDLAKAS